MQSLLQAPFAPVSPRCRICSALGHHVLDPWRQSVNQLDRDNRLSRVLPAFPKQTKLLVDAGARLYSDEVGERMS
jgi:hypothetical protein